MNAFKKFFYILAVAIISSVTVTSCIEDGISSNPAHQPQFSCDTLHMGVVFTEEGTPTFSFMVYNRHDKIMSISSISLRGDSGTDIFRINVDGQSGKQFSGIEIRPNDSIYVFVEATLPPNGKNLPVDITDHIDFVTNGVSRSVVLEASGQDIIRCKGEIISSDTRWTADKPRKIIDSLVVAEGVTLTLEAGVKLLFHDKARLTVHGTLVTLGTPEKQVEMSGDRTGNVVADITFDVMSAQWGGVVFRTTSRNNTLSHTDIRNTSWGVQVDSIPSTAAQPALKMLNCRLHNSAGYTFASHHSAIEAIGCEFSDASQGVVWLSGGEHTFNHCTFANYYLFTALGGPAIQLTHVDEDTDDGSGLPLLKADFTNSIIYGNGSELSHDDLSGRAVTFRRCLFKSEGQDDDNFIDCLWDTDPMYFTEREEYIFDYRLRDESPALNAADPSLTLPSASTDRYGISRLPSPSLGAYQE